MDAHEEQMRAFYAVDLPERVNRPLDPRRLAAAGAFAGECTARGLKTVLEVGCGAGRDGELLAAHGLTYAGIDLSPSGSTCAEPAVSRPRWPVRPSCPSPTTPSTPAGP